MPPLPDYRQKLDKAYAKVREGSLEEALRLAEEGVSGAPPGREGHLARMGLAKILLDLGEFERADALASAAMAFAREADDPVLRAHAHLVSGRSATGQGRFREGVELLGNAWFDAAEFEDALLKADILVWRALSLLESGEAGASRSEASRGLDQAREAGDALLTGLAASVSLRAGCEEAAGTVEAFLSGEALPPSACWFARFALGEWREGRGDEKEAEQEYAKALKVLRSIWSGLAPKRRTGYLATAPLKRFCARLVNSTGAGPPLGAAGTSVLEVHREVLERTRAVDLSGIEEVIAGLDDADVRQRLETFRSKFRNLMRLQEVVKAVNSEAHVDRLLALIMDHAMEIAGAERGFIMLEDGGRLKVRTARNLDQERVLKPEFKISHSIAEETFQTGKPILTSNAREDPRFAGAGSVFDLKLTSVLCFPLRTKEKATGVIYLDNRFRAGQFTPEILSLLEMFGDQASIALENARLFEENVRAKEELLRVNRKLSEANRELSTRVREQEKELERAGLEGARAREPRLYGSLLSRSDRMKEIFDLIDKVVESDVPVLIEGESGTGKELVARVIHQKSARAEGTFVSENCASISETLLESELFGHVRGAFTGAVADRVGLFELADGGTLFLDEVGETSPGMQKKLLRALQEGEIRPVGAKAIRTVNARIISASNRNLRELVREGAFREDLYYRLNVLRIELPPLRERPEDVFMLMDHFFGAGASPAFSEGARRFLLHYRWPGNVRELENFVERMKTLEVRQVTEDDLPPEMRESPASFDTGPKRVGTLAEMEERFMRSVIAGALKEAAGNKTRAAEILGIPKTTLYNKMKRYGIEEEPGEG